MIGWKLVTGFGNDVMKLINTKHYHVHVFNALYDTKSPKKLLICS